MLSAYIVKLLQRKGLQFAQHKMVKNDVRFDANSYRKLRHVRMFHIGARHDGYSSTPTKTEAMWMGSKAAINKLTPQDRSLTVSSDRKIGVARRG